MPSATSRLEFDGRQEADFGVVQNVAVDHPGAGPVLIANRKPRHRERSNIVGVLPLDWLDELRRDGVDNLKAEAMQNLLAVQSFTRAFDTSEVGCGEARAAASRLPALR